MEANRRYPSRPLVGAGAVVHRASKVLLLQRRNPPNRGRWALPGGLVELGETVEGAASREVKEETGLDVKIEGLIDVQTDIHMDERGRLEYHFVLVDFAATRVGGRLRLNGESSDSGWFSKGELSDLDISEGTKEVLRKFFESSGAYARRLRGVAPSEET